jgi:hypothetical protein
MSSRPTSVTLLRFPRKGGREGAISNRRRCLGPNPATSQDGRRTSQWLPWPMGEALPAHVQAKQMAWDKRVVLGVVWGGSSGLSSLCISGKEAREGKAGPEEGVKFVTLQTCSDGFSAVDHGNIQGRERGTPPGPPGGARSPEPFSHMAAPSGNGGSHNSHLFTRSLYIKSCVNSTWSVSSLSPWSVGAGRGG